MSIKQKRTAEQMRKHLSDIFMTSISDPRLHGLSVMEVKVDRELKHAHVYVGSADDEREHELLEAIGRASSYLRRELAQRIQLRTMPMLYFHWDPTLAQSARINDLLDTLDIPELEPESGETNQTTVGLEDTNSDSTQP